MVWDRKIPFDKNGNLMNYVFRSFEKDDGIVWKDNFEFSAALTYSGHSRGRSSILILFTDVNTDKEYSMFITDFDDVMKHSPGFTGRSVSGRWTFCKRGQNFGIKMVLS